MYFIRHLFNVVKGENATAVSGVNRFVWLVCAPVPRSLLWTRSSLRLIPTRRKCWSCWWVSVKSCFAFVIYSECMRSKWSMPSICAIRGILVQRAGAATSLMYIMLMLKLMCAEPVILRSHSLLDPVSKVIMVSPVARSLIVQEEETCGPFPVSAGCSVLVRPWCPQTDVVYKS